MRRRILASQVLMIGALVMTCACSRGGGGAARTASDSRKADAAPAANAAPAPASFDCTKVFSASDTAGVMAGPVSVSAISMSTGSCELKSPDGSDVQVSVDTDRARALWDDPNQRAIGKYGPVTGLGDEAFARTTDDGAQAYIKKGNHYCELIAGIEKLPVKGDALARQVGSLCIKAISAL